MKSDSAILPGSGTAGAAGRRVRGGLIWLAVAVAMGQLGIALSMMANHVRRPEITVGSDAWHMQYYHQFSEGGHSYYPRGDVEHVTDGYTPLASEIFGWTIRLFGPDIRWVRLVASVFRLAGMVLVGACVHRLTGSRLLAWVGAGLAAPRAVGMYGDARPEAPRAPDSKRGL